MRAALIFLTLVGVLAIALFAFGQFDAKDPTPDGGEGETEGTTELEGGPTPATEGDGTPAELPPIENLEFPPDTRVLMLSNSAQTPLGGMMMALNEAEAVKWQAWYLDPGAASPPDMTAMGVPRLEALPTAEDLDTWDVDVVLLDNVDPARLADGFLAKLAERIKDGRTGLLVQCYPPLPAAGGDAAPARHALLDDPALAAVLPVEKAEDIRGTQDATGRARTPGIIPGDKPTPFRLADDGVEHPVTAYTRWPRWTRAHWTEAMTGEHALGTRFAYPVSKVREGASVLLTVAQEGMGDPWPVLIATPKEQGRVVWCGTREFGWEPHYSPERRKYLYTVRFNMFAWLAGGQRKEG